MLQDTKSQSLHASHTCSCISCPITCIFSCLVRHSNKWLSAQCKHPSYTWKHRHSLCMHFKACKWPCSLNIAKRLASLSAARSTSCSNSISFSARVWDINSCTKRPKAEVFYSHVTDCTLVRLLIPFVKDNSLPLLTNQCLLAKAS